MQLTPEIHQLEHRITGICKRIFAALGPGLQRDNYVRAIRIELTSGNFRYEIIDNPADEKSIEFPSAGYIDFIIDDLVALVIVSEKKAAEQHRLGLLKSFESHEFPAALLLNFGSSKFRYERILPTELMKNA